MRFYFVTHISRLTSWHCWLGLVGPKFWSGAFGRPKYWPYLLVVALYIALTAFCGFVYKLPAHQIFAGVSKS